MLVHQRVSPMKSPGRWHIPALLSCLNRSWTLDLNFCHLGHLAVDPSQTEVLFVLQ